MLMPTTEYATTTDGLSIAYQLFGEGDQVIVWVTGTASHVELLWEIPGWAHALRRLSSHSRVLWFDKRGAGLSDRSLGSGSLENRMEDIRAVMDAAGVESAVLIGVSEGGAIGAAFAATFPERVSAFISLASWAYYPEAGDGATYFERFWGTGRMLERNWAQGMSDRAQLGRIERAMGSPRSMAALVRLFTVLDVRPVLPLVSAPSLVIHCTGDPVIPVEHGREFASLLPSAQLVEIEGAFHGSARPEDIDLFCDAIETFLLGETVATASAERVLATVLFTDIVGSTERAVVEGDLRWAELLDDHDRLCQRTIQEARGRVVKMTGDGLLATFDGPASAINAAQQIIDQLLVLGVQIRAGIHTGEVERRGDDIGGIGVNLASRVMSAAGTDEVWVSSTVPGLTIGAPIEFESKGTHELKGIPGAWELFAARRAVS